MQNLSKELKKISYILIGSFIYAIAINAFIVPNKLLSGGVAGIGLLLEYLFNIPSGYFILAINIPIFIIGYKKVGGEFTLYSFIGMISVSLFLVVTQNISAVMQVEDIFVATLLGGVLSGIGMGLTFKVGASQGGTDIIAVIIRRRFGIRISTLYMMLNIIIVGLGVVITDLTLGVYTLVSMYIKSYVMEKIITLFDKKHILMIITSKEEEVSKAIMDRIGRGITYLYGEGAYTGTKRKVLYCIIVEKQLKKAKAIIDEIDSFAIISVSEALDVQGKGFFRPAV